MVLPLASVDAPVTSMPVWVLSSVSLAEAMASGRDNCAEHQGEEFHLLVCHVADDDLRVSVAQADATVEGGWRVIEQLSYLTVDTLVGDLNYHYGLNVAASYGWLPVAEVAHD